MTVAAAAGHRGADRRRRLRDARRGGPPGALPAARALRRPHRLAALHSASSGTPPRAALAVVMPAGRPQLLRRRGARRAATGRTCPRSCPRSSASFFRVSQRPEDTFVAGLSMGGYGALKLGAAPPRAVRRGGQPLRCARRRARSPRRSGARSFERVFDGRLGPDDDLFDLLDSGRRRRAAAAVRRVRHRGPSCSSDNVRFVDAGDGRGRRRAPPTSGPASTSGGCGTRRSPRRASPGCRCDR